MSRHAVRRRIAPVVAIVVLAGCGVHRQSTPDPINMPTVSPSAATPSLQRNTCPPPTGASPAATPTTGTPPSGLQCPIVPTPTPTPTPTD